MSTTAPSTLDMILAAIANHPGIPDSSPSPSPVPAATACASGGSPVADPDLPCTRGGSDLLKRDPFADRQLPPPLPPTPSPPVACQRPSARVERDAAGHAPSPSPARMPPQPLTHPDTGTPLAGSAKPGRSPRWARLGPARGRISGGIPGSPRGRIVALRGNATAYGQQVA